MMHLNPILAAAAADMFIGMFWYSDYAFGPLLRKVTGIKCDVSKQFYLRVALQLVSSLMLATAFYIAVLTFQKTQLVSSQEMFTQLYAWFFTPTVQHAELFSALKIAGFMWLGFFVPASLSCAAWHNAIIVQKYLIKTGGKLAQLLGMAAAIAIFG